MKQLLLALFAVVLLGSCSTVPPAPAGMAWVYPEALRGAAAVTYRPHVVIRELDHQELSVENSSGLAVRPGPHSIVVSMIAQTGSAVGQMAAGRLGGAIGALIDELHSTRFEQVLTFVAEPGHTYRACVLDDGQGYRYWIEDQTARRVVAGAKYR